MAAMQLEFDAMQGDYKQNTEADYVNDYNWNKNEQTFIKKLSTLKTQKIYLFLFFT